VADTLENCLLTISILIKNAKHKLQIAKGKQKAGNLHYDSVSDSGDLQVHHFLYECCSRAWSSSQIEREVVSHSRTGENDRN